MSLAEFAFQSTSKAQPSYHRHQDKYNEIKKLINHIQEERQKSNQNVNKNRRQGRLDIAYDSNDNHCGDSDMMKPQQDMEELYGIKSIRCDGLNASELSISKEYSTRPKNSIRTNSNQNFINTTTKSLQVTPHILYDIDMFRISTKMAEVIKDHETLYAPLAISDNAIEEPKTSKPNKTTALGFREKRSTHKRSTHNFLKSGNQCDIGLLQSIDRLIEVSSEKFMKPIICRTTKQLMIKRTKTSNHSPNMIHHMMQKQDKNRALSYQLRNQRICNAHKKRCVIQDNKVKKLKESIQNKEQHRLDYLTLKKNHLRQVTIIKIITLVTVMYPWFYDAPKIIEEFRYTKSLNIAASKIQKRWKKEVLYRKAMEARKIRKKLKKFSFRIHLWARSARRRLNAQIIRHFLEDFSVNPMPFLIYKFRCKVMKAQQMMKSFVLCKNARILALERSWVAIEKELAIVESSPICKHRKRKSDLSEVTHQNIVTRGNDSQRDRKKSFADVLTSAVQRPSTLSVATVSGQRSTKNGGTLCRVLCRFHLEDSRRSHMNKTGLKHVRKCNSISRKHAIQLLSGEDINVNVIPVREWPLFSLFYKYKDLQRALMKEFYLDQTTGKNRVENRMRQEAELHAVNQFAAGDESLTESNHDYFINNSDECLDQVSMRELKVIFDLLDLNEDGKINKIEIEKLYQTLGFDIDLEVCRDKEQIQSILGDGDLNFEKFVYILNRCTAHHDVQSEEAVISAFDYFSTQGHLLGEHLNLILQSYEGRWTKEYSAFMLKNAGISCSKMIDYRGFIHTLYSIWGCKNASDLMKL